MWKRCYYCTDFEKQSQLQTAVDFFALPATKVLTTGTEKMIHDVFRPERNSIDPAVFFRYTR